VEWSPMRALIRCGAHLLVIAGTLGMLGCGTASWRVVRRALPKLGDPAASAHPSAGSGPTQSAPAAQVSNPDHEGFFAKILPASWLVEEGAEQQDPEETKAHLQYTMGLALEKKGEYLAAEDAFEEALRIKPDYVPAMVALARIYQRTGRADVALQLYDRLVELAPNDPAIWNDRGLCYSELGDLGRAEACMKRAVDLDPMRALYRNNLGMILARRGYEEQAWEQFRLAVGPALAHYNLAVIAWEKGDLVEARRRLKQALALDPKLGRAQALLEAIKQGKIPEVSSKQPLELQPLRDVSDAEQRPRVRVLAVRPD